MIAASDPQEFIPGGRQQASRHPGPLKSICNFEGTITDHFLLHRLEKVSLAENSDSEWWSVRESPNSKADVNEYVPAKTGDLAYKSFQFCDDVKSQTCEMNINDSLSLKTGNSSTKTKRMSDASTSKGPSNKRFSQDNEILMKNDSRSSCNTTKSSSGAKLNKSDKLNTSDDIEFMEEELYVKGNVVVWSKGLIYDGESNTQCRKTISCYSSQYPIKQALWCTFYCEMPTFDRNSNELKNNLNEPLGDALPSISILDAQNIRVFVKNSEDFIVTPPFIVKKLWACKFGIILERENQEQQKDFKLVEKIPAIFSLSHPLDEVRPVKINPDNLQYVDDQNIQVVFVSEQPSICMLYDNHTGQHSIYKIRRAKREQWIDQSQKMKSLTSIMEGKSILCPSVASPFSSRATSGTSGLSLLPSRSQSPMATISRCQSPAASPLITARSPWFAKTSRLHTSLRNLESNFSYPGNTTCETTQKNLSQSTPQLCFDQVWNDNYVLNPDGIMSNPATRVFLSDDLTGQSYLCYLVPAKSQLSILKIDISSSEKLSFGISTSISAQDAIAIPKLQMIAILEHSGNVVLYSGLTIVGKLHIGGVLAQHVPSPCVMRQTIKQFPSSSPFFRRSSLLPHCNTPGSVPKFDEHLLSPVLPSGKPLNILHLPFKTDREGEKRQVLSKGILGDPKSYLNGLRDATGERITLQYSDGTYYRITLPKLASSPIVEKCLNAFKQILPRDALVTLLTRWYTTRNAPGPSELTSKKEWEMFTELLLDLLGYEEDHSAEIHSENSMTPSSNAKRQRSESLGTDADWAYMTSSDIYQNPWQLSKTVLKLKGSSSFEFENYKPHRSSQMNVKHVLFPHIKIIHFALHLLYEELKLNLYRTNDIPYLIDFLSKLSVDLRLESYYLYYWKEFPNLCIPLEKGYVSPITDSDMKFLSNWAGITDIPPSIMGLIENMLKDQDVTPYPHIKNLNDTSRDIVQICGMYIKGAVSPHKEIQIDSFTKSLNMAVNKCDPFIDTKNFIAKHETLTISQKVVAMLAELDMTIRKLDSLPIAIKYLLQDAIYQCRDNPPGNWSSEAYNLLQRNDLAAQVDAVDKGQIESSLNLAAQQNNVQGIVNNVKQGENDQEDGMDDIESPLLKLRFSEDLRVAEARKLLQSAKPVTIALVQRPDVSDHDFIGEQEKHLYTVCTRTMALPVGRGMFTLRTVNPVVTEPLQTPTLCLTGKAPPRGTTVELTHIDTPQHMDLWPLFHNGVANGLRVIPEASNINSCWIVFNKPKNVVESPMEHAGFLMGLGLNGHLRNLTVYNTYDYLIKTNEMTSVGVLLGLATAFRGTANLYLTKMISLHIEALLPPTSMELDVSQNLQVAALLGIGLLYQETAHRHMTEVLLTEIGRPPGPEMENSIDRESYSLAAGLALGLVTLKHGGKPSGLSDLNVPDYLHYYMVGGNKRPLTGSQKDKYKLPSFQIREGNSVNLDVTAPGATLALGLMYLGSNNKAIADWMAPPETQYLLDFVRPDFLMLRILSRALILWNDIEPSTEWVEGQVPATIRPHCMVKPTNTADIDYEAMNQAYCNIIAGACFALGLRYAGSANESAYYTLLQFCHMFTSLTGKSIAELAGKPTIETCLNVILISISMVMAGTGNLEIMRIIRHLRRRVGMSSIAIVTYGSHLAIHMALGLLFLGGGRYTLSNSPSSVAALICAFYPKFPTHSNDNRYHLQAFRHLYVLAVEPRLIIPKDAMLGRMCYAKLNIVQLDGSSCKIMAPTQLPDLNTLYKVSVEDERYWNVTFERGRNWDLLVKILNSQGSIDVKQKVGYLSYLEDKTGFRNELARTITKSIPWDPHPKAISQFSSDVMIRHFTYHFLLPSQENDGNTSKEEIRLQQTLTKISYDTVIKDKVFVIPVFSSLLRMVRKLNECSNSLVLKQLKLILEITKVFSTSQLIPTESILALHLEVVDVLKSWEKSISEYLASYLNGKIEDCDTTMRTRLAFYVTFYNIPFKLAVDSENILEYIFNMKNLSLPAETIDKILEIKGAFEGCS